jgi:hypothetical protein
MQTASDTVLELATCIYGGFDDGCVERDIPTVSAWGLTVMTLLTLTAGTIVFARMRRPRSLLT